MDLKCALVLALTSAACISDLVSGKVKNAITLSGWAAGLALSLAGDGIPAKNFPGFLAGAGIPLALGYVLFHFKLLGAGDGKLFSAVGGITGIRAFFPFAVWSFVFGGAFSILILLSGDNAESAVGRMSDFARKLKKARKPVAYRDYKSGKGMFHFTVPMLMAAVLYTGGMF